MRRTTVLLCLAALLLLLMPTTALATCGCTHLPAEENNPSLEESEGLAVAASATETEAAPAAPEPSLDSTFTPSDDTTWTAEDEEYNRLWQAYVTATEARTLASLAYEDSATLERWNTLEEASAAVDAAIEALDRYQMGDEAYEAAEAARIREDEALAGGGE